MKRTTPYVRELSPSKKIDKKVLNKDEKGRKSPRDTMN